MQYYVHSKIISQISEIVFLIPKITISDIWKLTMLIPLSIMASRISVYLVFCISKIVIPNIQNNCLDIQNIQPVSYTHLTLPTILRV